jgi:hypothetical protein
LHGKFKFEFETPKADAPKLQMIGIDLNKENIKAVNTIQQKIAEENNLWYSRVDMSLINVGISNFTGTIKSLVCDVADEDCSLKYSNKRKRIFEKLQVTTVDAIVDQLQTKRTLGKNAIAMLLIDTEGNDPLVIEGAFKTLNTGIVRCLIFEYHKRGYWQETTLQHVTEYIGQFGYSCYFSVMGALWPLNQGTCVFFFSC